MEEEEKEEVHIDREEEEVREDVMGSGLICLWGIFSKDDTQSGQGTD